MIEPVKIVLLIIGAYLFGNINVALTISKFMNEDVRKMGSGNPGTMNMIRNFGFKIGMLTLFLDALKGVIPTLLGWLFIGSVTPQFGADRLGAYIGALSVITGHIFPVFLKFKGGKGIASTIGICAVIHPIVMLCAFVAAAIILLTLKIGSIASFTAISMPLAYSAFTMVKDNTVNTLICLILIFCIFALTIFAHRANVIRLFQGTESKTKLFKKHNVFSDKKH